MTNTDRYHVGQRLRGYEGNHDHYGKDYEVAGLTEGGDVLIRRVLASTEHGAWDGGVVYGPARQFSAEEVDKQFTLA